jgi:parvulin-like peptidyl-prolyl isomerase
MLIRVRSALLIVAGALVGVGACSESSTRDKDPVIVQVGDRSVSRSEFEEYVAATGTGTNQGEAAGELKAALLKQFIEEQLLLLAAQAEGVVAEPAEVERLSAAEAAKEGVATGEEAPEPSTLPRRRSDPTSVLRIRKLLETRVLGGIAVSDAEVAAHYESRRPHFRRPEAVDISQILLETREEADKTRQELAARPQRFEELAEQRSIGPEAARGGRLGAFRRGELPTAFENEVFGLPPGRLSPVVETDFGYHIFRVNRIIKARDLSLKEAGDAIRVELMRRKSDEALARYLAELRRRYPVEVFTERLGFPYLDREARGEELLAEQGKEASR